MYLYIFTKYTTIETSFTTTFVDVVVRKKITLNKQTNRVIKRTHIRFCIFAAALLLNRITIFITIK
jgi:hypothetical protein